VSQLEFSDSDQADLGFGVRASVSELRYLRLMSSPSIALRRLGSADVPLLRKLNALFGDAFCDQETYEGEPPTDFYLKSLLRKEHFIVLVAMTGERVLGGLVAYELDKFERMRREIYIYDLAIAAEHRRRRIATALIERLRTIAAERGAWVVYVQADRGDDPAIALYGKLGRREDVFHFDIEVETPSR
jgi:aminoglycoside 3-N-acetyltransferase I